MSDSSSKSPGSSRGVKSIHSKVNSGGENIMANADSYDLQMRDVPSKEPSLSYPTS